MWYKWIAEAQAEVPRARGNPLALSLWGGLASALLPVFSVPHEGPAPRPRRLRGVGQSVRKKLLVHFNIFMQKAPVWYRTFVYASYDTDAKTLSARMRRDIVNFVFDNLEWYQSFDEVPIY